VGKLKTGGERRSYLFTITTNLCRDRAPTMYKGLRSAVPEESPVYRQRCVWHILRELIYTCIMDGYCKTSQDAEKRKIRRKILYRISRLREIALTIPELFSLEEKERTGEWAMAYARSAMYISRDNHMKRTHTLLKRFIEEKSLDGAIKGGVRCLTTSKIERLMHTLKNRTSVGGSWSEEGVTAVGTIRLAMFYNGWGPEECLEN